MAVREVAGSAASRLSKRCATARKRLYIQFEITRQTVVMEPKAKAKPLARAVRTVMRLCLAQRAGQTLQAG